MAWAIRRVTLRSQLTNRMSRAQSRRSAIEQLNHQSVIVNVIGNRRSCKRSPRTIELRQAASITQGSKLAASIDHRGAVEALKLNRPSRPDESRGVFFSLICCRLCRDPFVRNQQQETWMMPSK